MQTSGGRGTHMGTGMGVGVGVGVGIGTGVGTDICTGDVDAGTRIYTTRKNRALL